MTAYGLVTGYSTSGRKWQQEHYESKSGDARVRATQLRKLGFKVSVSPLGPQVTPIGTVRMTMLTIENVDPEQLIPAPDQVKRLNPTPLKTRRPLTEAESKKLWAKYAPYFRYLSSRSAPGGGSRKRAKKNAPKSGWFVLSEWGTYLAGPYKSRLTAAVAKHKMRESGHYSLPTKIVFRTSNPSRMRPKRLMNYGEGNLFNFHGAFTEKATAVAKEQSIPGAFIRTVWFKGGPRYGVLTRRQNPAGKRNFDISRWTRTGEHPYPRTGDRVTIVDRFGSRRTGRAVMPSSTGGWVLNMGGPHGRPGIASAENIVKVSKRKNTVTWGKQQDQKFTSQALAKLFPGKRPEQLTMKQLSEVMQLAQAIKTGKKNPVRKVPGGWRAIGARGRMGPVLPTQRDAEIYAESLKLNPHQRQRAKMKRRNYADATELYKRFHGKGPSKVTETNLPTADYGNHHELGQLGKMVSLTIGDEEAEKPWKKKIEWASSEAPDLAAEPGGRQLYLIGGSQNLNGALEHLPIDTDKDLLDLGFAYRIEYFTQKKFDNFQPVTYYHDLGEETGDRPRVVYDRVKKRIHLVGGAYEVKPEGIVN